MYADKIYSSPCLTIDKDKDMPLIFIGHSFGGIVIKKALVMAQISRSTYTDFGRILDSACGIIFLGTPHDGAHSAGVGGWVAKMARRTGLKWHESLLKTLSYRSEELWKLGDDFAKIPSTVERVCFHETRETPLIGGKTSLLSVDVLIVTQRSASIQGVQSISLDCNHSQMNKFQARENPNYIKVYKELRKIVDQTLQTRSASIEEAPIVEQIREVQQQQIDNKNRKKFLKWLSEIRYDDHHNTNSKDVLTASGKWLLEGAEFQSWIKGVSVLWLRGIPGSGKTKLTSIVIDYLKRSTEKYRLVYFYCMRDSAQLERAQPEQILRAILKQLVITLKDSADDPVEEKYNQMKANAKEREEPPRVLDLNECTNLILELTSRYPVTIVIDALDECDPNQRINLLEVIDGIMKRPDNLTRIFISSRDDRDIFRRLEQYPNIVIEASKNISDIQRFVIEKVDEAIQKRNLLNGDVTPQLRDRMIKQLQEGARGMFRWVSLQIAALCDPYKMTMPEDVEQRLRELPKELDDLYAEIYKRIKETSSSGFSIAKMTLTWLLYAQRQLSSEELLMVASTSRSSGMPTKRTILDLCCNLVTHDENSKCFTFAHLSVREFLEKQNEYHPSEGHARIAKFTIKLFTTDDDSQPNQLCPYASLYWPLHYRYAVNNDHHRIDGVFEAACTLFSNKGLNKGLSKWSNHGKKAVKSLNWTDDLRQRFKDA
ncbi:hypothetical protein CPB86DRAFT_260734 [Serendipita vermifera]|nr:hypothetical protein CPB86DRAFT_260734 [Serendipita vermifera]